MLQHIVRGAVCAAALGLGAAGARVQEDTGFYLPGQPRLSQSEADNTGYDADTDAINIAGDVGVDYLAAAYIRGVPHVSDRIDLFVRAGYALIEVDSNVVTPGGSTVTVFGDSADGFAAGAGLTFDITENLELRSDYTWYGSDDVDAAGGTVTLGYKF